MGTLAENRRLTASVTANAGQTDFAADFPVLRDKDGDPVGVFMRRVRGDAETILELGDFTIPAAADNGFTCRLVIPAEAGDRYQIFGRHPASRDRAHAPGGATRTATLEGDGVQFAAQFQEQRRDLDRAVRAPLGEEGHDLPSRESLKARIAWGNPDTGNLEGLSPEIAGQFFKGEPGGNYESIGLWTAFAGFDIREGTDTVRSSGYSVVGVGSAVYAVDADQSDAPVTAYRRKSSNGRWFRLAERRLSPTMFGAVPSTSVAYTGAWQAALDYVAGLDGAVIDMAGEKYRCGAIEVRHGTSHLTICNGWITVDGDVEWILGETTATSITYLLLDQLFIDHSAATTAGRAIIDASLFAYAKFRRIWAYNGNPNKSILIYAAGSVTVGPYYNVVEQCYCGGFYAGVLLASAASVLVTANNWTITDSRFQPNAGFWGVVVGDRNQNIRIMGNAFENVGGGTGVLNDGDGTVFVGNRFEGLAVGIEFGAMAQGWSESGSYHNSNTSDRTFAGGAETRGVLLGDYDSNFGDSRPSYVPRALAVGVPVGGLDLWATLQVAGGQLLSGDPGFPSSLTDGRAFAYASPGLGHVDGGQGATNDSTRLNKNGLVVSENPTGTQRTHFKGAIRLMPGAAETPAINGEVTFELTSNTTLTIKARGSDGIVRAAAVTLA